MALALSLSFAHRRRCPSSRSPSTRRRRPCHALVLPFDSGVSEVRQPAERRVESCPPCVLRGRLAPYPPAPGLPGCSCAPRPAHLFLENQSSLRHAFRQRLACASVPECSNFPLGARAPPRHVEGSASLPRVGLLVYILILYTLYFLASRRAARVHRAL